ncbi:hypothetical protein D6827_03585 [Candidatus Parcubacteria bacterium]|nr:MAG: hypothetical protein D6827_03585 [Candidatus Parcubacteria bacterium]
MLAFSCHTERVETGCYSGCLNYETTCSGVKLFGVCLGSTSKTCTEYGEKCNYEDKIVCGDDPVPASYLPDPNPQETGDGVKVDEGTSYTYTPPSDWNTKPDRSYSFRYICSGRVIKSPYITGYEYIAKQKICTGADCGARVVWEKVTNECINDYKVCRMDGGSPKCVRYVPDVKISLLAEKISALLGIGK